jgi:ABC-type Zn uptake system ZnuABC Zn-binding protein ZnuA
MIPQSLRLHRPQTSLIACVATVLLSTAAAQAQRLSVCCSVPDLASLVQAIGGENVSVTAFAKGTEDPHFVEAKPSFVKSLSQANLLVMLGLGMEDGWSPVVLQSARNPAVASGAAGYLDASSAIRPLDVPAGVIDRSQGDVHIGGNPHYLLDPICGMQVARLIRDKLTELRPNQKALCEQRCEDFCRRMGVLLIGEPLAKKYKVDDYPKLALLFEHGKLEPYLKSQREDALLGGWLGMMLPYFGTKAVDDHNMWPYFARRFGVRVIAHMEPKPGVPPTTQHLGAVAQQMRTELARIVLANPYYDPRHAQFLAASAGAKIVNVAHQVGSRPGTDDYLSMVDYNVRQLASALAALKGGQ